MKVRNISNKIIGIGSLAVLPEETKEVPFAFMNNEILTVFREQRLIEIIEEPTEKAPIATGNVEKVVREENITPKKEEPKTEPQEATEEDTKKDLRKAQINALKDMSDEEVGKLAKELGIKPASCKNQADVRKKVKKELEKEI